MPKVNWQTLPGRIVAGKYELQQVIRAADDAAEFKAVQADTGTAVEVALCVRGAARRASVLNDLEHNNLRRVFDGGTDEIDRHRVDYAVMEAGDAFLVNELEHGPMPPEIVRQIASDCVGGLAYLHERDLVYMNLRPDSVVRVGDVWKLAEPEFAQPIGNVNPTETRPLLSRSPYAPPEAFNGVISPAWDVWSLGLLLKRLLVPQESRVTNPRRATASLPAPFDDVIQRCLRADPAERPSVAEVAVALGVNLSTASPDASRLPRRVRAYSAGEEGTRRKVRTYSLPPADTPALVETPIPAGEPMLDVTAAGVGDHGIYEPPAYPTAYDRTPAYGSEHEPAPRQHALRTRLAVALAGLLLGALLYVIIWRPGPGVPDPGELTKNRTTEPARSATPLAPSPVPVTPPPGMDAAPAAGKDREQAVRTLLTNWADSTRNLDLERHALCYAPRVERFFRRRNLTREQVKDEKRPLFADIDKVRRLQINNVKIESLQADRAVVSLRKEWDFAGAHPFAGAEIERLTLGWINGRWQITGEEERKVEWTRRTSRTRTEGAL